MKKKMLGLLLVIGVVLSGCGKVEATPTPAEVDESTVGENVVVPEEESTETGETASLDDVAVVGTAGEIIDEATEIATETIEDVQESLPEIATEEATDEDIVAIADFVWSTDLDTNWKRYSHTMNGVTVSMDISKSVPIEANEDNIFIQPLIGEKGDGCLISLYAFNPDELSLETLEDAFMYFKEDENITIEVVSEDESVEFCGTYAERSIYDVTDNSYGSHFNVETYVIPYSTNDTDMTLYIYTMDADYLYPSFGNNEEVAAGMFDHVFNSIRLSFNQEAVDEQGQTEAE